MRHAWTSVTPCNSSPPQIVQATVPNADGSQGGSMSYNQSFTAGKGAFDLTGSISGSMNSESYAMTHVRGGDVQG